MTKLQILGTGCPKCEQLSANARKAAEASGAACTVEDVKDLNEILKFGVMMTPAIAVDGEVKASGKVVGVDEITSWLQQPQGQEMRR
jgi:small redox-active disulfide protein 2